LHWFPAAQGRQSWHSNPGGVRILKPEWMGGLNPLQAQDGWLYRQRESWQLYEACASWVMESVDWQSARPGSVWKTCVRQPATHLINLAEGECGPA